VIPAVRDPSAWSGLSLERRAKRDKAGAPVAQAAQKKNLRFVELGNGLAPSATRAKELGITENELSKLFWDGVSADYAAVTDKCNALRDTLSKGNEVRITHTNGTDLKVKVKGRKLFVSDGTISDADKKAGGPNVQVWLPAGEVYLAPVPGSAEGKLVDDRFTFDGKEISGITVDVKAGKATNVTAKSGWESVKALWDGYGARKNEVGVIDFGCNPALKASGKFENWVPAGTVTVMLGENAWAGGNNNEPGGMPLTLNGATVTVDGKPVIENGALK
jgi:aminopeptidase